MSRIVRNTTAVTAAFLSNTVLTFVQIKLLTRYLPQSELGEYYTTFAIGAIVSVFAQVGLPMVVLRFTAKYDALEDDGRIWRLVRMGWAIVASLSVILLLLEWRVAPGVLARIYEDPPAATNVLMATAVFVVVALRQVTYAAFDGMRRMVFPAVFENVNITVITVLIASTRNDLTLDRLFMYALVSGSVVFLLASAKLLVDLRGSQRPLPEVAVPVLPDISPFWSGAAMNGLVGICFGFADRLLISLFLPYQLVSIFVIAERLTFLMKRLLALPLQVASPEITRRWEVGRRDELRSDIGFLLKAQLALALLVGAVAFALAEPAVLIISTEEFLPAADLLRVLTMSVVLMALYAPITTFMRAIERIHLALVSDVIWIGLYIGTGCLLVPRVGLDGIVIAHVIASIVTTVYNLVVGQRVGHIRWDLGGVVRVAIIGVGLALLGRVATGMCSQHILVVPLIALAMIIIYDVLLVRSGALSASDRRRFRELAGGNRAARLIDTVLFWPLGKRTAADE